MELLINALISYFVIIDPVGVSIIFAALTADTGAPHKRKMALRAAALSMAIVLLFGFFGAKFLAQLGIAIEAFKIAGGLLLFYTAFCMVTKPDNHEQDLPAAAGRDISVYPMTIPFIAGPGCLTLTILLFAKADRDPKNLLILSLAVLLIYSLTLILFLASGKVSALFGRVGNSVLKRLLGVLLAALSIQYIIDGIRGFLR